MSDQLMHARVPLERPFGRQLRSQGRLPGTVLSAVLHVLVIGLLVWAGRRQFLAAGGDAEGRGGGGGGGGGRIHGIAVVIARAIRPPTPPPPVQQQLTVPQQVVPLPVVTPPPESLPPAPVAQPAQPAQGAGQGPGQGPGLGPGAGTGTGGGTGGGTGTGTGNDSGPGGGARGGIFPPQSYGLLIPPQGVPRELHGVRIAVTFQVSERGDVVSVRTDPEIRDRGYRNDFLDKMRHYTFRPARTLEGRAVAAEFTITVTL